MCSGMVEGDRLLGVAAGWLVVVAAVFFVFAGQAAAQEEELPETPVEYERYALEHSPELRGLYEKWQSRLREAEAAGAEWPQPKIGYTASVVTFGFSDVGLAHMGSVSQTIPWPGVLDKAAEPARRRAEGLRERFEARVLETVFEVRKLLIEIARIDELRAIHAEQRTLYRDVQQIVEQNLESGEADRSDLLRLTIAEQTVADRLDTLESAREQSVAELREYLGLSSDVELSFDFTDGSDPLEVPQSAPEMEPLVEAAREAHPEIAAARADAEAAVAGAEFARARRLPWPTVSLGVDNMPVRMGGASSGVRRTALSVGFSVPLPLFGSQYDLAAEGFEHQRAAQRVRQTELARRFRAQIDTSVTRIDEHLGRLERYRKELIPLAGDATAHIRQQITTGERTITDYLLSFEQEFDLKTSVVEFRATIAGARARLEKLTGGEFDAYPDRESPDIDIEDSKQTGDGHE